MSDYSGLPDFSADGIMDSVTDMIKSTIAILIPIAVTITVLILLRLIMPPIINKIAEKRTFDKIRDGEEIPAVLHSHINKKKHVPVELLPRLFKKTEACDSSWTACNKYAQILQNRAKVKNYFDRKLCIMLEVKKCRFFTFKPEQKLWHIEQKKSRLTKLVSYKGHFYLKSGDVVLRVDEKTYQAVNVQAVVAVFEIDKKTMIEVFMPM
ncbi:MAG: hypothetical protein LBC82_01600 [Oscillospiraceae bacterium]|jgi:hypothetical protein|nr:hypothetical protein [Oscillospiraceae bacterium]